MHKIILTLLKQARLSRKLKQADVGEAIGVKGNTVGNYENGITEPDIETFIKLCKLYGIDYVEILEAAYGKNINSEFSSKELEIIKKYRQLDADGKERIDYVLNLEYKLAADRAENKEERLG